MIQPELYLWSRERELFLARHDFYMDQMKARVLGNFQNMEEEADLVAEQVYERIGSMLSYGESDMAAAADAAFDHASEFYMMLCDLKKQTTLGALASLFHQWEKDLRGFMERELSRSYVKADVDRFCWQPNIGNLFDCLEEFGWSLRQASWFPQINACRLIVNVYKHGKGRSLEDLAQNYPQYLKSSLDHLGVGSLQRSSLDHENLAISEVEFGQIADALRQFWVCFPERLYVTQN